MDLQMPVLDGLEATAQIRRFERENAYPRASVVAYTSNRFSGSEPVLRACGMDAVLEKPCDAETLHACLRRWCKPLQSDASRTVQRLPTAEPLCDSPLPQYNSQGSVR
jgi:two-component system, sensor histidine kinase and response regulator